MIKLKKKPSALEKEKKNQKNQGEPFKLMQRSQIRSPLNPRPRIN